MKMGHQRLSTYHQHIVEPEETCSSLRTCIYNSPVDALRPSKYVFITVLKIVTDKESLLDRDLYM